MSDRSPLLPKSNPSTPRPSSPLNSPPQTSSQPPPSPIPPSTQSLYKIPTSQRPKSHGSYFNYFFFPPLFLGCCVSIVMFQIFLLYPVYLVSMLEDGLRRGLRHSSVSNGRQGGAGLDQRGMLRKVYDRGIGFSKDLFGGTLVIITVLFAPTNFTLTADKSVDLEGIVVREDVGREEEEEEEDGQDEYGKLNSSIGRESNGRKEKSKGKGGGRLVGLALPENLVVIANHQAYLDWVYIWTLGRLSISSTFALPAQSTSTATLPSNLAQSASSSSTTLHTLPTTIQTPKIPSPTKPSQPSRRNVLRLNAKGKKPFLNKGHGSRGLIILLKKSLKWVPIVGWGMQFFEFVFMARKWDQDQQNLTSSLTKLAKSASTRLSLLRNSDIRASQKALKSVGNGLWLLIFPEGTITSDEERGKSLRWAEKEGVPDFTNVLHPRSTGLLFCLRTLMPHIPDLKILDVTIVYPGVTRGGYAQEWYNLFSVYHRGVPPPTIHVHLSLIDPFATPLPGLGTPNSSSANSDASFPPIASSLDAKDFNLWLRDRWALKEKLIDGYFGIEAGQGCGTVKGELLDVEVESGGREVFEIGFSWMDGME